MDEAQMHEQNCFLTLTYDEDHLPEDRGLVVKDWQDFAHRLRKRCGPFRYFHCGEYGDANGRPHYHAAIFGLDFWQDRVEEQTTDRGDKLYTSPELAKTWGQGLHAIGDLTFESAAYVARYIMKKITGNRASRHYERIDPETGECTQLKPEYCTMSLKPGIGRSWIEKYMTDVYPWDEVITNGHRAQPPKYYDAQYHLLDPEGLKKIKARRIKEGKKHEENNTPDRLAVRETVAKAKTSEHMREIHKQKRKLRLTKTKQRKRS